MPNTNRLLRYEKFQRKLDLAKAECILIMLFIWGNSENADDLTLKFGGWYGIKLAGSSTGNLLLLKDDIDLEFQNASKVVAVHYRAK